MIILQLEIHWLKKNFKVELLETKEVIMTIVKNIQFQTFHQLFLLFCSAIWISYFGERPPAVGTSREQRTGRRWHPTRHGKENQQERGREMAGCTNCLRHIKHFLYVSQMTTVVFFNLFWFLFWIFSGWRAKGNRFCYGDLPQKDLHSFRAPQNPKGLPQDHKEQRIQKWMG